MYCEQCVVSILDTVFVEKQQIWSWFYSTSGGIIRKKPRAKLSVDAVHDEFAKSARVSGNKSSNDNGVPGRQYAAVCWFGDQIRTMQFFSAHELFTFLNSLATSDGSACLSAFIAPRGGDLDPLKYANMEHEFTYAPACFMENSGGLGFAGGVAESCVYLKFGAASTSLEGLNASSSASHSAARRSRAWTPR